MDAVDLPPIHDGGTLQQQASLRKINHRARVLLDVAHAGFHVVLEGLVDVHIKG